MNIFAPTKPEKVIEAQLYEARRMVLEHANAAEYHQAMEAMLVQRIRRLQALRIFPNDTTTKETP